MLCISACINNILPRTAYIKTDIQAYSSIHTAQNCTGHLLLLMRYKWGNEQSENKGWLSRKIRTLGEAQCTWYKLLLTAVVYYMECTRRWVASARACCCPFVWHWSFTFSGVGRHVVFMHWLSDSQVYTTWTKTKNLPYRKERWSRTKGAIVFQREL